MKITYIYQSLNYIERSGRRSRFEIYRHSGRADIPELRGDDAPVAGLCRNSVDIDQLVLRTWNGKLYAKDDGPLEKALAYDLETQMLSYFAEHLLKHRLGHKKKIVEASGRDARPAVWESWRKQRRNLVLKKRLRETQADKEVHHLSEPDPGAMLPYDNSHWSDIADKIVENYILIDGQLWIPTAEPILSADYSSERGKFEYDDLTAFKQNVNLASALPKPYGSRDVQRNNIYGAFWSDFHKYWNPSWSFAPITDAKKSNVDRSQLNFEIVVPEMFKTDISPYLIERAARLTVVFFKQGFMNVGNDYERFLSMKETVKALYKLTKNSPQEIDLEQAIARLRGLRELLPEPHWYQRGMSLNETVTVGIRHLIQNASHYWDERPVTVPSTSNSVQPRIR
jgi:hypothetical protein